MKHLLVVSIALATLALPLWVHLQAQQNNSVTVENGVAFINPGSPVLPESEFNSKPIPRLPDGKVDLTGPWVGGGAVADIEANGGRNVGAARRLAASNPEVQRPVNRARRLPPAHDLRAFGRHFFLMQQPRRAEIAEDAPRGLQITRVPE